MKETIRNPGLGKDSLNFERPAMLARGVRWCKCLEDHQAIPFAATLAGLN